MGQERNYVGHIKVIYDILYWELIIQTFVFIAMWCYLRKNETAEGNFREAKKDKA